MFPALISRSDQPFARFRLCLQSESRARRSAQSTASFRYLESRPRATTAWPSVLRQSLLGLAQGQFDCADIPLFNINVARMHRRKLAILFEETAAYIIYTVSLHDALPI